MLGSKTHRHIYIALLALLGISMVTSVWVANLAWVLMGVNWLLEGRWTEKWQSARTSKLLHAYLALYALLLVGMLWSHHWAAGLRTLQVELPLLIVPLVMLTTRPVEGPARRMVLSLYSASVLVVSLIALVRMLTIPALPYRDSVPFISHIRFALNCCMVIVLCLLPEGKQRVWRWLVAAWLVVFVLLLRSYTAIAILTVISLVLLLAYRRPWPWVVAWCVVVGGLIGAILYEAKTYYHLIPQATEPLQAYTEGGRPYDHEQGGIIENGNYVGNYVCLAELRSEWQHRSTMHYDSLTSTGYSIQPTLIRYLNALGLPKDSVGVWTLTPTQIHHIEQGIANPVYAERNPLRKMVYTMLFERECYVHTHAVVGFTMLQRFEMWHAAWHVISRHRWVGVGTGDVDTALLDELQSMQSPLAGSGKRAHNQYLSLLLAVGSIGFCLLLVLFLRAAQWPLSPMMLAWLLAILISFLTEDTLDTLAGILFCTFFLAFRPPANSSPTNK